MPSFFNAEKPSVPRARLLLRQAKKRGGDHEASLPAAVTFLLGLGGSPDRIRVVLVQNGYTAPEADALINPAE